MHKWQEKGGERLSPYDPPHTQPRSSPNPRWLAGICQYPQGGTLIMRGFTPSTHQVSINSKSSPINIRFPPFINRMPIRPSSSISACFAHSNRFVCKEPSVLPDHWDILQLCPCPILTHGSTRLLPCGFLLEKERETKLGVPSTMPRPIS